MKMSNKPNIILIVADDMGYGDFGLFSEGRVHTPVLDNLAQTSMRLTQNYCGSAVCSPSRAALMTGRYPHKTGGITPQETLGYDRIALDEVTMADTLKADGYATGLIGKWHNGALDRRYHPNARGFDEFIGFCGGWMDYYDWWLDRNGVIENGDGTYLTDVLSNESVGFINRHAQHPFFLNIAFNAPHSPLQAPETIVRRYEEKGFSRGISLTYAMIEVMDKGLGKILQSVRDNNLENNTIFMFTSDNGPAFILRDDQVPKGVSIDTTRFNIGMNGAKGTTYEGGIRVPMIIRWPDGLPMNQELDTRVHFIDWLPTLAQATGSTTIGKKDLDGRSVLNALRGTENLDNAPHFWQWNMYSPVRGVNAAMRDQNWKLVKPGVNIAYASAEDLTLFEAYVDRDIEYKYNREKITGVADWPEPERITPILPSTELYDLSVDPGETNNLAEAEPARTRLMETELDTWFDQVEGERRNISADNHHPTTIPAPLKPSDTKPFMGGIG